MLTRILPLTLEWVAHPLATMEFGKMKFRLPWMLAISTALLTAPVLHAQQETGSRLDSTTDLEEDNPGLTELDQATDLRIAADSMQDLEKIIRLCESALKIGLDAEHADYTTDLLTATLFEHAFRLSQPLLRPGVLQQHMGDPRFEKLRQSALNDLQRLLERDESMGPALILRGQLESPPLGDRQKAFQAFSKAIVLLGEDGEQLSKAYQLRSRLAETSEGRFGDLEKAIAANADNSEAWEERALSYLSENQLKEAVDDFNMVLEKNPESATALLGIGEALLNQGEFENAIKHLDRAIEAAPRSQTVYLLRANAHAAAKNFKAAIEDVNKSIEIDPTGAAPYLVRSQLRLQIEEFDLALADVNRALELAPRSNRSRLLRISIYVSQGKLGEAIADLQELARRHPENLELKIQLADLYRLDRQPDATLDLYDKILAADPENMHAHRGRADALLNVGKQAQAIKSYEAALKLAPEDSGILNNLAWVLATSPDDQLRNGQRSLELATRACEVTEYQAAHILSTLAAAHAELGNFDKAIENSTQAVENGSEEMKGQLQKELDSYQQNQPWREIQELEKNEADISNEDGLLSE
ncbi:MAG: hypothetical protein CMJ81_07905 [Planctomycetaceae bacterium]|nr:hypothetical protein [Planctomycetaceae bacterium]